MSLTTYREVCNELLNGLDELQGPRYPFPGYITAAMDRARELLAQPAPATPARLRHCPTHGQQPPEAWGCPECVRELREELAALRTPPADGEVGELVDFLERLGSDHDIRGLRAAELLQQQAAELATLRQQQAAPVPVSERPWENEPRWLDPDGECWWCPSDGPAYWSMVNPAMVYGGWLLPAHAVPMPPEDRHHG